MRDFGPSCSSAHRVSVTRTPVDNAARARRRRDEGGLPMTVLVEPGRSTSSFVAGFVLTGMVTTVLGPILPELLIAWHLTDAAGGALFTAQFTGSVSAGLVSGFIVARLGDARTLAIGYALMAVGLLALAGGGYAWGVAGACLAGLGMGCVIPPTNLLVARERPERAAAALGG